MQHVIHNLINFVQIQEFHSGFTMFWLF